MKKQSYWQSLFSSSTEEIDSTADTLSDSDTVILLKLIDDLQADLRSLSSETRRKFPQIKEAAEKDIRMLKEITANAPEARKALLGCSTDLVHPLLLGCNTKINKVVLLSLSGLQKLVTHELLSEETAAAVVGTLWGLMESGVEELRLLQTTILLITTNSVVKDKHLAKALVLSFRLHFTKNSATINTAAATIRQCASAVFERVVREDYLLEQEGKGGSGEKPEVEETGDKTSIPRTGGASPSSEDADLIEVLKQGNLNSLRPCAKDAFLLFKDLCLLVNGEPPVWLQGLNEMTRTLGLEIIESLLVSYSSVFQKHKEFTFLLKERVCPLVIKLFSPSLKFKPSLMATPGPVEKPSFPMVCRLIRMITVIIKSYFYLLNTECEIFLSLLIRFLDTEKPLWQRALALEVLQKFVSQPQLIKHICESYDMKEHSTKIFREVVNALSSFIQSSFVGQSSHSSQNTSKDQVGVPPALVGGMPVGAGVSPQSGFSYRGNWIPLHSNPKTLFYDMLEKTDPPSPADGYCVSLGFHCIIEVVRSLQLIVEAGLPQFADQSTLCNEELINAAWCGVLAALSLLLETSTDESATESILRGQQAMVSMCGGLGMITPRDAFVTALCKSSLPANYALAVLSHAAIGNQKNQLQTTSGSSFEDPGWSVGEQSQVVVVGSGLPVMGPSSSMGPIMLTAKNIQCMRSILSVAHCHGGVLGTSWHLVLTTLQHLVWILGLKVTGSSLGGTDSSVVGSITGTVGPGGVGPGGGSAGGGRTAAGGTGNSVITTAVLSDMPVLSTMLVRLFESSQYLDEVALHHLIDALCKLSSEAIEIAYASKEPSLFAVAKLMETGIVNIGRIEVWWKPVYAHLLEVCLHTHTALRQLGADALVTLVREAINYKFDPTFWKNTKLNTLVLHPLSEMSNIPHGDVCQKQLDCVQYILHNCGDQVADAWLRIIRIVGSISDLFSEQLIRNAFQCLQLIITDYLSVLQDECYPECVRVAARFAHQKQDLNIALTAVGSIWHITDYFFQQCDRLRSTLSPSQFEALWICIHTSLADLCIDSRPAVRKSSGQTLFNTIDSHGSLLESDTWKTVLWKVLFPLLESVQEHCASAPAEREEQGNLLMHHSRDTAAKQWAETHVLTLSGVAHVFTSKQATLLRLEGFLRAWKLLLECIETSALSTNSEISLNALRSLQEAITINPTSHLNPAECADLWAMAWQSWLRIGGQATHLSDRLQLTVANSNRRQQLDSNGGPLAKEEGERRSRLTATGGVIPQQAYLTLLLQLFPALLDQVAARFTQTDLDQFCIVVSQALSLPTYGPNGEPMVPMLLPAAYQETGVTPLQEAALKNLNRLTKEVINGPKNLTALLSPFFTHLLSFANFAVHSPKQNTNGKLVADCVPQAYVIFGEKCTQMAIDVYNDSADTNAVIKAGVLEQILKMLHEPLSLKYNCPSQTTWQLACHCLIRALHVGVPVAKNHNKESETMWVILEKTLRDFLFTNQKCLPGLSLEEFQKHEALDCKVIHLIRDQFLSNSEGIPDSFIEEMISLLNTGSIHSTTTNNLADLEGSRTFREELAQLCFQTLLDYSFQTGQSDGQARGSVTRAAVKAILTRCHLVLAKYVEDERLSGKCPLPRARLSEVGFVLKAMSTLLSAFKNAPKGKIDDATWKQVIDLYPQLVDCVTLSGGQFMKPLRMVLHEFGDLLQPYSNQSS